VPLPLPNLDDRTFNDLVAEGQSLIPRYAPEWTNHNPSDPGITLVELFAFLTELLLYRLNRVSDDNVRSFLRLLNGSEWKPSGPGATALAQDLRDTVAQLRRRERAVTAEDFEALAREADPRVARACCVPRRDVRVDPEIERAGNVSLIVVPRREGVPLDRVDTTTLTGTFHTFGKPADRLTGVGTAFPAELVEGDTISIGGVGTRVVTAIVDGAPLVGVPVTMAGPPGGAVARLEAVRLRGTVHSSGQSSTTLTGVGTTFASELQVGNTIAVAGVGPRTVTAIASDSTLTIDLPATIPGPSQGGSLIESVKKYLDERRLLTTQVNVVGSQYVTVRIRTTIVPAPTAGAAALRARVVEQLQQFLDPLEGGEDASGWPFGRNVFVSEIYQLLERLPGVDHVVDVTLTTPDPRRVLRSAAGRLIGIEVRAYEVVSPQVTLHDVTIRRT